MRLRGAKRSIGWLVGGLLIVSFVAVNHSFAGPLSVTPSLDTTRAVSATMSSDGGTLTTTAADGTVFTLALPAGALLGDEEIIMTPVLSIGGLPFSGQGALAGAVQLTPEGLFLVMPATLVIQPSASVSIDEESPFAWYNIGADFHMYPLTLDLTSFTMNITRLNGYGLGKGTSAERDTVYGIQPSRADAELEQEIQKDVSDARQILSQNPTKSQANKALKNLKSAEVALIQAYITAVVPAQAGQDAASASNADLRCLLLTYLNIVRELHICGLTLSNVRPFGTQILNSSKQAFNTLANTANAGCNLGDIQQIGVLLGLAKLADALAGSDRQLSQLSKVAVTLRAQAANCQDLKLKFVSTFSLGIPGSPVTIDIPVLANVPLKYAKGQFTGEAPLVHLKITTSLADCQVTTSVQDSTLKVLRFGFFPSDVFDVDCPGKDPTPPNDYDVVIDIGHPTETFTVNCPGGIHFTADGEVWRGFYMLNHINELLSFAGNQFRITGWDNKPGGIGILAEKFYLKQVPGLTEDTGISLQNAAQN